ncbi:MAG: GFA family protein [Hyphomicrobiales bacterium]|nr:GFA family protein [Hyphomicrobiales bacterium]MCP5373294.1 GFA family protein [Hyphomicrobiales bacterium]
MQVSNTGGCHCGAVRFEYDGEPLFGGVCHCRDCQRFGGAPLAAGIIVPRAAFRLTRGATKVYASSEHGRRHFCADCGSSLFFEPLDKPAVWEIFVGVLDDPMGFTPRTHIWCRSALPWLKIDDDAVRFDGARPADFKLD